MNRSRVPQRLSNAGRILLRLSPYLVVLIAAFIVFGDTLDDCYITFRYAANILGGHGAVFNVGEHVEGYTSPRHLVLCTLLTPIVPSLGLLVKAKAASLVFAIVMITLTGKLGRAAGLGERASITAQLLLAVQESFAVCSVNALETTLYGAILLLALLQTIRELESPAPQARLSGFIFFVATLARPECMLIYACVLVARHLLALRRRRTSARSELLGSLYYGAPFAAFLLARWSYYGALLPNTYYAKYTPLIQGLRAGAAYLFAGDLDWLRPIRSASAADIPNHALSSAAEHFVLGTHLLLFWFLAGAALILWRGRTSARSVFVAVLGGQTLFLLRSGGDWMPGWRFVVPILPILAVLQCSLLRAGPHVRPGPVDTADSGDATECDDATAAAPTETRAFWLVQALVRSGVTLLLILLVLMWPYVRNSDLSSVRFDRAGSPAAYSGYWGERWTMMARYVRAHVAPGATVATSEIGYVGYMNLDKRILDLRGLTDWQVARLSNADKSAVGLRDSHWDRMSDPLGALLSRRRPDLILTLDYLGRPPTLALGCYAFIDTIRPDPKRWMGVPTIVYQRVR